MKTFSPEPSRHQPVHVESNAFSVAVDVGFHADQLRVHVVGAGLGQGGHGVGRESVPAADADVGSTVSGDIFAPRKVGDEDIDGRAGRVDADLAVAAHGDGPDIAGSDPIGFDDVDDGGAQFIQGVRQDHSVDLAGVEKALHVLREPEDGGAGGLAIAADAFKHARAVMNHVAHDVYIRLFPGNEVTIAPDFFGRLDGHE